MSDATIVGGHGFIGSSLAAAFRRDGRMVHQLQRDQPIPESPGDLFFCAGLTADFRTRPSDTIRAPVSLLNDLRDTVAFDSLTYCSSTRVYNRADDGREEAMLRVNPNDSSDLYNLSKLAGEARCLADPRPSVRVVRIANVFGPGDRSSNFLTEVVRDALTGSVVFRARAEGAKDYLAIDDLSAALARVPSHARSRLLNLASSEQVTNRVIGNLLAELIGTAVCFGDERSLSFPLIDNRRMRDELGVTPTPFNIAFPQFLKAMKRES